MMGKDLVCISFIGLAALFALRQIYMGWKKGNILGCTGVCSTCKKCSNQSKHFCK